jgi:nicotinate dehydrogenase subunit B
MKTRESIDIDLKAARSDFQLKRREFMQLLGPGVFFFFAADDSWSLEQESRGGQGYPEDFNAYLRIGEDGRVTCYSGKIEMGQGLVTSLAQMLAEELVVSFGSVDVVLGDTKLCPWDGGTNGSRSIKYFGPALRAAAAEAREVLIQMAAENLQLPVDRLQVMDGVVSDKSNPQKRVSYAALAKGKTIQKHLERKPALKPHSAFVVCGKPMPRKDALEKVTGKARYAGDMRLPGMLYAKILRPPVHGAKLKSVDVSAAKEIKGARIIQDGDLVAALHTSPDQAEMALSKIKAEFETPETKLDDRNIHEHLLGLASQGQVVAQKGDLDTGKKLASLKFEEAYYTPYVAHASTETHAAVAQVEKDSATVWISTQRPFGNHQEIARALGMPAEQVRIITPYVGGGFGGKSSNAQAIEAARLSKMTGAPVHVARSREEEFFYDTFMPAAIVKISSGLNESNRIVFWDYEVLFAGERSSQTFYDIPHHRTVFRSGGGRGGSSPHPFGTGAWRGPGSNTNIFARESHMDIMAAKAGIDPVEFRLKNLADQRMVRVLKAAAEKFGWSPAKAPSRRGHGVACLDYLNTYVALMAEIKVDPNSGRIHVNRVVAAQDVGQVINPEGLRMQMEGCITMGLGFALSEEIHFKGGDIKDRNFDSYDFTRFSWVPRIETVLLESPEIPPQGAGESTITGMGAVIANSFFDATGIRAHRLPLTPERYKPKA